MTGSVTVSGNETCPAGAPQGGLCQSVSVTCPGLSDLGATVEVLTPSGPSAGTVVLHSGGCGEGFFDQGFVQAYLARGLRVVDVAWAVQGWCGADSPAAGLLAEACRPATLFQWIFTSIHQGDRTKGFCAEGFSGGSGALSYALAHYGAGSIFDEVMLVAGPPFGRVDYGCDPTLYTGPALDLCAELPSAPDAYLPGFATQLVNGAEGTTTCGADGGAGISGADIATWKRDGVVSVGADYDYPLTPVSAWYCVNQPNETTGLGFLFLQQITSSATIHCGGGSCTGEGVFNDPTNFQAMVDDMTSGCVPRH